jgi:hypothetical protein
MGSAIRASWRAWPRAVLSGLGLALALAGPGRADDADLCIAAAEDAQRLSGVPFDVLLAIALTETGRGGRPWPWTVNLEGQGHWFATRAEATAFAESALAQGRTSFDIGCFQVNWRWHGENFVSVAQAFDPLANASYAASFLKTLQAETGGWSEAAGAYHSRTPEHAGRYRVAFDGHRAAVQSGRVGGSGGGSGGGFGLGEGAVALASAEAPVPRVNAFPLLRGGGGGPRLGSLVPLGG